ncbi:MAG: hypothetical protein K8T90_20800 [Planctomycetes bacterium]|nr:hypothetical protein [Planctomycetota bacterium]
MRLPPVLRACLLLFATALVVRVGAALVLGIAGAPVEDEIDYVALARSLASGRGFSFVPAGFEHLEPRMAFRPPLLPLLLTPVTWLGGGVAAMRCVSIVCGALVPVFAYLGLRRTSLGERARWVGVLLAFWPTGVWLSIRVLAEPLAAALILGAIAVPPDDAAHPRRSALAGALAGLSVLARPASIVVAALLAGTRGGRTRALWFAAALTVVVAPWAVRNAAIHGRPLLTTNTGVTLVGGNSAASLTSAAPGRWLTPDVTYAGAANAPDLWMWGWSGETEESSDRRFAADAIAWTTGHPADAARLAAWKFVRFFDPDQHSAKPDAALKRAIGWATFAPVLLFALAGLWLSRGDPALLPWALLLAGTLATSLVFYSDTRMRSPADPAFAAFAAVAAARLVRRSVVRGPGGR